MLRGAEVRVEPEHGERNEPERLVEAGWVDLRESSWARWRGRTAQMLRSAERVDGAGEGSHHELEPWHLTGRFRPGTLAAWVFRHEDRGERIKR